MRILFILIVILDSNKIDSEHIDNSIKSIDYSENPIFESLSKDKLNPILHKQALTLNVLTDYDPEFDLDHYETPLLDNRDAEIGVQRKDIMKRSVLGSETYINKQNDHVIKLCSRHCNNYEKKNRKTRRLKQKVKHFGCKNNQDLNGEFVSYKTSKNSKQHNALRKRGIIKKFDINGIQTYMGHNRNGFPELFQANYSSVNKDRHDQIPNLLNHKPIFIEGFSYDDPDSSWNLSTINSENTTAKSIASVSLKSNDSATSVNKSERSYNFSSNNLFSMSLNDRQSELQASLNDIKDMFSGQTSLVRLSDTSKNTNDSSLYFQNKKLTPYNQTTLPDNHKNTSVTHLVKKGTTEDVCQTLYKIIFNTTKQPIKEGGSNFTSSNDYKEHTSLSSFTSLETDHYFNTTQIFLPSLSKTTLSNDESTKSFSLHSTTDNLCSTCINNTVVDSFSNYFLLLTSSVTPTSQTRSQSNSNLQTGLDSFSRDLMNRSKFASTHNIIDLPLANYTSASSANNVNLVDSSKSNEFVKSSKNLVVEEQTLKMETALKSILHSTTTENMGYTQMLSTLDKTRDSTNTNDCKVEQSTSNHFHKGINSVLDSKTMKITLLTYSEKEQDTNITDFNSTTFSPETLFYQTKSKHSPNANSTDTFQTKNSVLSFLNQIHKLTTLQNRLAPQNSDFAHLGSQSTLGYKRKKISEWAPFFDLSTKSPAISFSYSKPNKPVLCIPITKHETLHRSRYTFFPIEEKYQSENPDSIYYAFHNKTTKRGQKHSLSFVTGSPKKSKVTNSKVEHFLQQISNKTEILKGIQRHSSKSPMIILHHEYKTTREPTKPPLLGQLQGISSNISKHILSGNRSQIVNSTKNRIFPIRHKGGDPGNHYYHAKHSPKKEETLNVTCEQKSPEYNRTVQENSNNHATFNTSNNGSAISSQTREECKINELYITDTTNEMLTTETNNSFTSNKCSSSRNKKRLKSYEVDEIREILPTRPKQIDLNEVFSQN